MVEPPGQHGLVQRLATLERRIAELTRSGTGPPVCVLRLNADQAIPAASDVLVENWRAETDPAGLWVATDESFMRVPHAGRWSIRFHTQWAAAVAGYSGGQFIPNALAGKIYRNEERVASSSVVFNSFYPGAVAGEGTTLDVVCEDVIFATGDDVWFGVWTRYPATVLAQAADVTSHVIARYLGPR